MEQLTNEAVSQKAGGARLKKSGGKTALVVVGVVLAVLVKPGCHEVPDLRLHRPQAEEA